MICQAPFGEVQSGRLMVIVDTHVIMREALDSSELSNKLMAKNRLETDASFLEIAEILKTGRNYIFQAITPEIADISSRQSAKINAEPADRIISDTSLWFKANLINADRRRPQSGFGKI